MTLAVGAPVTVALGGQHVPLRGIVVQVQESRLRVLLVEGLVSVWVNADCVTPEAV